MIRFSQEIVIVVTLAVLGFHNIHPKYRLGLVYEIDETLWLWYRIEFSHSGHALKR